MATTKTKSAKPAGIPDLSLPYKAKLLPLEGGATIKMHPDFAQLFSVGQIMDDPDGRLMVTQENGTIREMGLYMCSTSMSVAGEYVFSFIDNSISHVDHVPEFDAEEMVMIVGTISKGAIWVKDGMRFAKEDIELSPVAMENLDSPVMTVRYSVQVKGPCGHFH